MVADGIDGVEQEAEPMNHTEQQLPTTASKITAPLQKKTRKTYNKIELVPPNLFRCKVENPFKCEDKNKGLLTFIESDMLKDPNLKVFYFSHYLPSPYLYSLLADALPDLAFPFTIETD